MKRRIFEILCKGLLTATVLMTTACENPTQGAGDSAFITQVFDYQYAPGQYADSNPSGGSKNPNDFIGNSPAFLLLGGWGGYVVAGFDQDVNNNSDEYDLAVFTQGGVGSEPGVVFVMPDDNADGYPNDTWYELAGSETNADYSGATHAGDKYIRNYEVIYTKAVSADANITWTDNQGGSGDLVPGHGSTYSSIWWWDDDDNVTFTGVKLPDAKYDDAGSWTDYIDRFSSGYAENYTKSELVHNPDDSWTRVEYPVADLASIPFNGTDQTANRFDIGDAINPDGTPANLTSIRFIKVQSGVFQVAGWLNEISTEVNGAVNLHSPGYESYTAK